MKMRNQKGAAVVEFAVVLPLLLVLLFGIIEFSILLFDKALLTNASREGARVGIVFRDPRVPAEIDEAIQDVVNKYCANNLISFDDDTLPPATITRSGNNSGDTLTVTVNYHFHFLLFSNLIRLFGGTYGDGVPLSAVTVMRQE